MKKKDLIFAIVVIIAFSPFFWWQELYEAYTSFNHEHGLIMAFIKFAVLATLGEVIGLRIKTGKYAQQGFGILPRAIVWGFIGFTIKIAFVLFASGSTVVLQKLFGLQEAARSMSYSSVIEAMDAGLGGTRIITAFVTSVLLNLIFAPVFMTFHKITDTHITNNGGTLGGFFRPINFRKIFPSLNWEVQWNFVFKKTIPLFWIPAHTITFLLPPEFRVLFAALLGITLGIFLAVAVQLSKKN